MSEEAYGIPDDARLQRNPRPLSGYEEWVVIDPGSNLRDGSQSRYKQGDTVYLGADMQFAPPDAKGFTDRMREFSLGEVIPYVHMIPEIADAWKYNRLAGAVRDGTATKEDERELVTHLANQQRDQSFGYKSADIAINGIPYMIEFGLETALLWKAGGGVTIGSAKAALMKGGGEVVEANLKKVAAHEATKFATNAARKTAEKQLLKEVGESMGKALIEKPAVSFISKWGMRNLTVDQMENLAEDGAKVVVGELTEKFLKDTAKHRATSLATRAVAGTVDGSAGGRIAAFFAGSQLDEFAHAAYGWNNAKGATAAAAKEFGKESIEAGLAKGAQAAAMQNVKYLAPRAIGEVGIKMGAVKTAMRPDQVALGLIHNMSAQYALSEDEQGRLSAVLMDEGDGFLLAFAKAFGDVAIENISEQSAESFILLKGMFGDPAVRALKSTILKSYFDKGVAGAARKGIPKNQALSMLKKHIFGAEDAPGVLQKMGWGGVIAEMGEEGIGGALRMATGISKPGLPTLEDTAAMAVGFMFNPIAMAGYAHQAGAEQYVKMYTTTKDAITEAQNFDPKFATTGIQTEERTAKLKKVLADMAAYKQADSIHSDKSISKMQKMFRALWLDKVWEAQADYIGKNVGIESEVRNIEDGKIDEDVAGKAIMRRVEWDMEQLLDVNGVIQPHDIDRITNEILHTMVMSEADLIKHHENIGSSTKVLQDALKVHKSQRGVMLRDTKQTAPYFAAKIDSNMTESDLAALVERYPSMIYLSENFNKDEAPILLQINQNKNDLAGLREQAKNDSSLIKVATVLGLPRVRVTPTHGMAHTQVISTKKLRQQVNRKLDFLENGWKHLPQGVSMAQVPFRIAVDKGSNMQGQPLSDDMANVMLAVQIEASYNTRGDRTVAYSDITEDSGIAEDWLESFMQDEDGVVYDWVKEEAARIRKEYSNDGKLSAVMNANDIELVSKATAVHLGYGPNASAGSLKNIVNDLGITLSVPFMNALWEADRVSATNGATQGGIVSFLQQAHEEAGGNHGDTMSLAEQAKEAGKEAKKSEDAKAEEAPADAKKEDAPKTSPEGQEDARAEDEGVGPVVPASADEKADNKKKKSEANKKKKAKQKAEKKTDLQQAEDDAYAEFAPEPKVTAIKDLKPLETPDPATAETEDRPDIDIEELRKLIPDHIAQAETTFGADKAKLQEFINHFWYEVLPEIGVPQPSVDDNASGLGSHSLLVLNNDSSQFQQEELAEILEKGFTKFREYIDKTVGKNHQDAGQRLLWSYANGTDQMIDDISDNTVLYINALIDEIGKINPSYINRMISFYGSVTPLSYQVVTRKRDGKFEMYQSNPGFRNQIANKSLIGENWDEKPVYNGIAWHFVDVAGNGRPGYMLSSHILETIKRMTVNDTEFNQFSESNERPVNYRMLDGLIEEIPDREAGTTVFSAKDLQSKHEQLEQLRRELWERSPTMFNQRDGYWHIVTKAGAKDQMFMLYLPKHAASGNKVAVLKKYRDMYEKLNGSPVKMTKAERDAQIINLSRQRSWVRDRRNAVENAVTAGTNPDSIQRELIEKYDKQIDKYSQKIDELKKPTKETSEIGKSIASEFYAHPNEVAKMNDFEFDEAINGANVINQIVGDVAAFAKDDKASVGEFASRLSQSGTPGRRLKSTKDFKNIRYIVFEDRDAMDGMMFFRKKVGAEIDRQMGTDRDKDGVDTQSQVLKLFMNFRANGGTGSLHNYKPMGSNVSQFDQYSRYKGIADWLEEHDIDFAIAASSVKLGKSKLVDDAVKITDLYDIETEDFADGKSVIKKMNLKLDTAFDEANVMNMRPEDVIVGANYNYPMQPQVKKFLKQLQSTLVHYAGDDLTSYRQRMNLLTISRARLAKKLNLYDNVIPYLHAIKPGQTQEEFDDVNRFGGIQALMRKGEPASVILSGTYGELAYTHLLAKADRIMKEPVTRVSRTAIAPGEISVNSDMPNTRKTLWHDGVNIIPAGLDTNIEGGVYTEDLAESYGFGTKEQAIKYLEDNPWEMMKITPWMYKIKEGAQKLDRRSPVVNTHLIKQWTNKAGKEVFTFSGELLIVSRVPLSGISYATLSALDRRIGDGTASVAMSDAFTQDVKSEDQDADQMYIDMLPRDQEESSLAYEAHLFLVQAMQAYTPERMEYMKKIANTKGLDSYVDPRPEGKHHVNTMEGQRYLREVTSDWTPPLEVSASTAPTLRFLNELKIPYMSEGKIPVQAFQIEHSGQTLLIHRTQEQVDAMTPEMKLAHDQVWGNTILQFILDSQKAGNLHEMGYNKHSVALLYAMASGSIHLNAAEGKTLEDTIVDFAGQASRWLRENDAAQDYINRRMSGEYDNQIFSNKLGSESFLTRHGKDGRTIKRLANISNEIFHLSQLFSISHDWKGNQVGFVNDMNFASLPGKEFKTDKLKESIYHKNSITKANLMKFLYAGNPALEHKLSQKDTGYNATKAGAAKLYAGRVIQAAQTLNPRSNYTPAVFWKRMESNPMVEADFADLGKGILPYKSGNQTKYFYPPVLTMSKKPWIRDDYHDYFNQILESLTKEQYTDLMVASALTVVQHQAEHKDSKSHNFGFFRHATTDMHAEMSQALHRIDEIIYNKLAETENQREALLEELSRYMKPFHNETAFDHLKEDRMVSFNPIQGLEDATEKITRLRMEQEMERAQQVVMPMADGEGSVASHSLALLEPRVLRDLPQYSSTGWKIMLEHNLKMNNLAASERSYHKVLTERMIRMAGMVKNIGWDIRKIQTPGHFGKYAVINYDVKDENGYWGFEEIKGLFTLDEALAKKKELNQNLAKPTNEEIELGHQILQAITARIDDPNSEYIVTGVVSNGEGEGVESKKKNRYYITNNLNKTHSVIGSKTGYATEEIAEQALAALEQKGSVPAEQTFSATVTLGYELKTQKIDQLVSRFGEKKFNQIMNLAKDQIKRAEEHGKNVWNHLLGEDMPEGKAQYKEIFEKLKRKDFSKRKPGETDETNPKNRDRYAHLLDAIALKGEMPSNDGNIATVINEWVQNTWDSVVKASAVMMGTTTLDIDGDTAWMAEYDLDSNYNPMSEKQMALALSYNIDTVNDLREKAGMLLFKRDPSRSTKQEMNRLLSESKDVIRKEYDMIPSVNTPYVSNWWVKRRNKDHADFMFGTGEKKMLGKIESQKSTFMVAGMDVLKGVNRFNNWAKFGTLSFSAFHPFSLLESMVAMHGGGWEGIKLLTVGKRQAFHEMSSMLKRSRVDENLIAKWNKAGMGLSHLDPNIAKVDGSKGRQDVVSRDIELWKQHALSRPAGLLLGKIKDTTDRLIWQTAFPAIKLHTAEYVLHELRVNHEARDVQFDEAKAMQGVAQMMDDAFGSQNLERYIWSNRNVQQWLQMMAFAPDWTLSAFNISGAPNLPGIRNVIRANQSDLQKNWQITRYWPGMIGLVMFAIPQAMQSAVYAFGAALNGGDPDPDDTPFISLNEESMRGAGGIGGKIDLTPVLRHMGWVPLVGYKGGNTGKQRVYMELGKQAREVKDWFTQPVQTLKFKSSSIVQYGYEQMTGLSVGGWEIQDGPIISLVKKFAPMSLVGPLEGRPTSVLAPIKRGMTKAKATLLYAKSLKGYADKKTRAKIDGNPKYRTNLAVIDQGVLEAAAKNGVDPESVVNSAKRIVMSEYYQDFFNALNKEDWKKLEDISNSIKRIDGDADRTLASVKAKLRQSGEKLSYENEQRARDVFEN